MMAAMRTVVLAILVGLVISACASGNAAPPAAGGYSLENPKLGEQAARAIATTALDGFNTCDYSVFSTAWDDAMLAGISRDTFTRFCTSYRAAHGQFVRIEDIAKRAGRTTGYLNWVVATTFEKGPVTYVFALRFDGERITGSYFDPAG